LAKFKNNNHKIFRTDEKGLVELRPLLEPAESLDTATARGQFICEIAGKVEHLLQNERLESQNRPVLPSDIMILVQRRNPFAPLLIDELQRRNIPVAGSDRIKLPDFPAVRDLLNLARWTTDDTDDYMLACVLKSPLFRAGESDLFKLCHNRDTCLYNKIKGLKPDIYERLEVIKSLSKLPPYSFFMKVLAADDNRARMIGALGTQIIDPLEEFLTICLSYERTQPGNIKKFIKWFVEGGSEIVREVDKNAGIRIVTTHGSKGLESNIVILCDTVKSPKNPGAMRISEPIGCGNAFLWKGRLDKSDKYMQAESEKHAASFAEYYRLLYVAMTRARDRLYIFGFKGTRDSSEDSWHDMLAKILPHHPDATTQQDGTITISN
jgi:ATP-dependent helicase/nuclease subunit A